MATMICGKCGLEFRVPNVDTKFCPKCGSKKVARKPRSKQDFRKETLERATNMLEEYREKMAFYIQERNRVSELGAELYLIRNRLNSYKRRGVIDAGDIPPIPKREASSQMELVLKKRKENK